MRGLGKTHEFNHKLKKMLEESGTIGVVMTTNPCKIQTDLKALGLEVTYEPLYEGILGLRMGHPKRKKNYEPKIIGYTFKT